jgi:hypothetical protein
MKSQKLTVSIYSLNFMQGSLATAKIWQVDRMAECFRREFEDSLLGLSDSSFTVVKTQVLKCHSSWVKSS